MQPRHQRSPFHVAILTAAMVITVMPGLRAQELQLTWDGAQLHVTAPQLHFLTGKALDRIRNGNAVAFDFQLSAASGGSVLKRSLERFVISYDLWEERFAVTRLARDKAEMVVLKPLVESQRVHELLRGRRGRGAVRGREVDRAGLADQAGRDGR